VVAAASGQPVFGVVMGLYQPSGELIWLRIDAQPLFQAGAPTPWAAVATFQDITAQQTASATLAVEQPRLPAAAPARQRTILIVEDCAEDLEMYRKYLSRDAGYRYQILEAETGDEALEICQQVELDAVLLDYCLSDYEGLELLPLLNQQILSPAPILLVTGQGNESIAVQILKAGASDYLIKGTITASDLQTVIDTAITKTELRLQLRQSLERERLVAQVAQQIRQSLDLSTTLNSTVEKIRHLLSTDRVVIFQFHPDWSGTVIAESVGAEWPAILSTTLTDPCLATIYLRPYLQGHVNVITNIHTANIRPCHVEMLTEFHVQANLVVPILQGNRLWGLLIAHHCAAPRTWQTFEIDLLKHLSTQVGTAIQQAELYQKVQSELAERQAGNARLQLLYETVKALLVSTQPLMLIATVFENLKDLLELDLYLNYILEDQPSDTEYPRMRLVSHEGIKPELVNTLEVLAVGQAICGTTAQERQQVVLSNVQQSDDPRAALIRSMGVTAYAIQPLVSQGQLFGTLSFGSCRRSSFTLAETEFLQALCDQIAIALERANLLNSLQLHTEQLRETDRLKDEFLAVLSHELRNPLNPILGWTRLLQGGNLTEAQTLNALTTIERNAKLQSQLIDDLLDISRIMRGKLALKAMPVNLAIVVSASLETVRLAAEAKQIQIETTIDSQVPQVSGDPVRLQQVVWNLLSNAVKFTHDAGRIHVRLTHVDRQVQLQIIDTGKGINPDFAPYVFEYFRQEDGSTTRKFGGLGLGLAIARQVIELHGGRIWVESEGEGYGATFTFQLPCLPEATATIAATAEPSPLPTPLAGIRALVVDDDSDACDFLSFLLRDSGAIVTVAMTAEEALQALERVST
jgi:signal transduction histidine kinase/CheY-like chemotaxis protein